MTEPIRWGILGSGRVADGFATGMRSSEGAELRAVASRHVDNAQAFATRHANVGVHADYAALAADPTLDVIYVATPNHRHADDAVLCLDHGKAVVCEKPFTVTSAEARRVVDAARANGVFCMEGMWMRFIPAVRRAVELVESGAIGTVQTIHADFSSLAARSPGSRLFDPASGGGALLDLGVYTLSLAQLVLGDPDAVCAELSGGPTGVDEHASVSLGYRSGEVSTLTASLRSVGPNQALITGTVGTIRLPGPICAPVKLVHTVVSESVPDDLTSTSRLVELIASHRHLASAARFACDSVQRLTGRSGKTMRFPLVGNGYNYEIDEVTRCLRAGVLESELMPLDASVQTMETIERIRVASTQR